MREILFKAKTTKENEWIQSMTISNGIINRKSRDLFMEIGYNKWKKINPETLCQFTGLLDKNGNKIFEGDRVVLNYGRYDLEKKGVTRKGVVVYEDAGFVVKIYNSEVRVVFSIIHSIEVIGNIHENEGK